MSMPELIDEGERVGRKAHQCFDCYRPIPKGLPHFFSTIRGDGMYTLRFHRDCRAATDFYMKRAGLRIGDFDWDGIPPLADMISDGGEFDLDCAMLRGYFPHVVCRLEFSNQR